MLPRPPEPHAGCAFAARCQLARVRVCGDAALAARGWRGPRVSLLADRPDREGDASGARSSAWRLAPIAPSNAPPICRLRPSRSATAHQSCWDERRGRRPCEEVSFEIGAAESIGLVGETGSGKTTLARCLLGLTRPDSGRITLGAHDVTDYRRLSQRRADARAPTRPGGLSGSLWLTESGIDDPGDARRGDPAPS